MLYGENDIAALQRLNCYSFVLNIPRSRLVMPSEGQFIDCLNPGELALRKRFQADPSILNTRLLAFNVRYAFLAVAPLSRFAHKTVRGIILDGLNHTGDQVVINPEGSPGALFFKDRRNYNCKENDFHCYGLRRDRIGLPVWAFKGPGQKVEVVSSQGMFSHAKYNGYRHFGGYFFRPNDLEA